MAGVEPDVVLDVHRLHGVEAAGTLPRPRKLIVRRVSFSGVKHDAAGFERFSFDWDGLDTGLWAVLTDGNSQGKSSILKLVLAVLQGRLPGHVKPDVWNWIDGIDVSFDIDGIRFGVAVRKEVGVLKPSEARARVVRGMDPAIAVLHDGPADASFERAMSDVFMEELGFAKFRSYRSETDAASEHGWPAMSSALFIDGPGKAIFGGVANDGLPIRLMQLFIGMPWISTYSAASTALKSVQADDKADRETSGTQAGRAVGRRAELKAELAGLRETLAGLPDRDALRADLRAIDAQLLASGSRIASAKGQVDASTRAEADAISIHAGARSALQQAQDDAAAGYVFRRLRPSCCPACEASVQIGRFEATASETCGLCGNTDPPGDASHDAVPHLRDAVEDAARELRASRKRLAAAAGELLAAQGERERLEADLQAKGDAYVSLPDDTSILCAIAAAEARLDELARASAPVAVRKYGEHDLAVLEATVDVVEGKFKPLETEVLKEVSDALLRLAGEFGVRNLESLRLVGNGRLDVSQGAARCTSATLRRASRCASGSRPPWPSSTWRPLVGSDAIPVSSSSTPPARRRWTPRTSQP
ncbi:hypothetical protein [Aureimonas jatrophae]|uniref:AAA domain-containing protein n=1 Tax=Aureimonas jatrophae TaxID=1166073 RepID=A0A1H0LGV4_9HYPH|nr:hypothetical protein [Aureimonas jatrophae]MBB3952512.1 hypothetical protein [Aureimonas jatrophae]SDO67315.1 hypothetical protein SAMN05192530_11028 [Aureimonas jatrophae]